MKFKKVMAGALTGTMMLGMATVAFAEPVYYTDDKTEVAAYQIRESFGIKRN